MPPSSSPVPSNAELVSRAEDQLRHIDPKQFSVTAWANKAAKFFEDARRKEKVGDTEGAYVGNLSGMYIITEVMRKLKSSSHDMKNLEAVKKYAVDHVIASMEVQRSTLDKAREAASKSPALFVSPASSASKLNGSSPSPRLGGALQQPQREQRKEITGADIDMALGGLGRSSNAGFQAEGQYMNGPKAGLATPPLFSPPLPSSSTPYSPSLYSTPTSAVSPPPPPTAPPTIDPSRLHGYLSRPNAPRILVLDVRPAGEYDVGHIGWKRNVVAGAGREAKNEKETDVGEEWKKGATVRVEPGWVGQGLTYPSLLALFAATLSSNHPSLLAFSTLPHYSLIVYMDSNSTDPSNNPSLAHLALGIWLGAPPLETKNRPATVMLTGGWEGWRKQVAGKELDFIERGVEGWGGIGIKGSWTLTAVAQDGIVRGVADYLTKHPSDRSSRPGGGGGTSFAESYNPQAYESPAPRANQPLRPLPLNIQAPAAALARPNTSRRGSEKEYGQERGRTRDFDDPYAGFEFNYPSINNPSPRTASLRASAAYGFDTGPAPALPLSRPPSGQVSSYPPALPSLPPQPSDLTRPTSIMPRVPQRAQSSGPAGLVFQAPFRPPSPPVVAATGAYGSLQRGGSRENQPPPLIPPKPFERPYAESFRAPRASSPGAGGHQQRFFSPLSPPNVRGGGGSAPAPAVPVRPGGGFGGPGPENWELNPTSANVGTTGLKNMGNTCYMNSTVQCLSGTVPLAAYFRNGRYKRDLNRSNSLGTGGIVAERFAGLVQQLWRGDLTYLVPDDLRDAVCQHAPQFRGTEQQDSQEFLAFLMDALHEDLNRGRIGNVRIPPMTKSEEEAEARLPMGQQAVRAWDRYMRSNDSIIVRDFQGQYGSVLECLTCRHKSYTFNTFMYLQLPIPARPPRRAASGAITITDCLDEFLKLEVLDGEDAWQCPRERTPRKSTKQIWLSRSPNLLIVQLKRFYHEGPFKNKLDQYVDFPIGGWDLSRYLGDVPGVARDESLAEQYTYDLYAVSNHFGGLNGGHYTAFVRNGYRGEWYNFDDSRVTTISERDVKTKAAYILFYVRRQAFASAL